MSRRVGTALRARVTRLRPDLVSAPYLAWAVGCWLLTALVAVVILIPGVTDDIVAQRAGSSGLVGIFHAPLLIRVLVVAAGAVLVGTLVVVALMRERAEHGGGGGPRIAREITLAAAGGFPALGLAADGEWVFAVAVVVLVAFAEVAAHRPTTASTAGTVLVGLLVAACWVVLLVAQVTVPTAAAGWSWIALFGFAAAFAAFGSYYGVARAAETRAGWVKPLFRDDLPPIAVVGVVLLVVGLVLVRLTVARELFPAPDPELWSPLGRPALSWVHAVAVSALVVAVAARSSRRPLRRAGERRVTAALALVGNLHLGAGVGVILTGMVVAAATGGIFLADVPPVVVAALKVAGVTAIIAVVALPHFRGTAARSLGAITGAYLLPLTVHGLCVAAEVALPPALVGFPASPVQVTLVLLLVAAAGAVIPAVRRTLGTGLVVRLAVVPIVAVHAGWLLPAAWSEVGRIVLVVSVVLAFVLFMPRVAADRVRHSRHVLAAAAGQLLALVVFILALPSFFEDPQLVVLGLFWLGVAVIAALTVRTRDSDAPPDADRDYTSGSSPASTTA